MSALTRALSDADRMYVNSCKAVSNDSILAGSTSGLGLNRPKLSRAKEQYSHFRGWAYVAIKTIASRIAGQDCFVARVLDKPKVGRKLFLPQSLKSLGDRLEPLERHPLLDALDSPNQLMTRWPLMFSTVASLLITGRSFWWLVEVDGQLQIWPIPSHWLEPSDKLRNAWKLRPDLGIGEHELPSEDVAAFVLPDPSNPFGSISPLQAQAAAVATDEEIQNSQYKAFVNGVNPQLAIRVGRLPGAVQGEAGQRPVLEPEQRQQLVDAILRLHSGEAKKHHPLIVDGMIEGFDKLSSSPQEMDFLDSGKATKARIFQSFGVNPIVSGEIADANRAQAVVAGQQFCETLNPIIELMSQTITRWLGNRFSADGEKLLAWIDPCRANDPEQKLQEWKTARANGDVTQNEFRQQILNLSAVAGGDTFRDALGNPIERSSSSLMKHLEPSRNGRIH
ncbi:MAG: phage portal protein [Planctomycetes bacterium]|nr:phage portal protein [Planctomycetota bacterium]